MSLRETKRDKFRGGRVEAEARATFNKERAEDYLVLMLGLGSAIVVWIITRFLGIGL